MSFQVCSRDEYGQTANLPDAKFADVDEAIKKAKEATTRDNIENALTLDEKRRQWESCYVELFDQEGEQANAVYSGKGPGGRDMVSILTDEGVDRIELAATDAAMKIYIGRVNDKGEEVDWYAEDQRGNEVDQLNHQALEGKTVYYIMPTP